MCTEAQRALQHAQPMHSPLLTWSGFAAQARASLIVDVRSPLEFSCRHIPGAINIPLLDNVARAAVGTAYKTLGRQEAIKTGLCIVGPRLAELVERTEKLTGGKEMLVYCWRGGLRSSIFCQFMSIAGLSACRLLGGYKAYRAAAMEAFCAPWKLVAISGYTGSGKTALLHALAAHGCQTLDLEAVANHKGSVFGGLGMPPQPTTEQFQNLLFECLHTLNREDWVWLEDESIAIGKVFIPEGFWKTMRKSPVMLCKMDKARRADRLAREYGGIDDEAFREAMQKIAKRLGGQRFKAAIERLQNRDLRGAIEILLSYYDKVYLYSFNKHNPTVLHTLDWTGEDPALAAAELAVHLTSRSLRLHHE